ncbi:hypothetical protein RIF29_21289 [Crotalaria pallida]|uniref:Uncharacterized protein n=1 Tax=Crotalaria pallida TaxID=3830 RepID=A0AAN9F728_CROPI
MNSFAIRDVMEHRGSSRVAWDAVCRSMEKDKIDGGGVDPMDLKELSVLTGLGMMLRRWSQGLYLGSHLQSSRNRWLKIVLVINGNLYFVL